VRPCLGVLSATLADDVNASVKRIHSMIADLEKEGYDPKEIGADECKTRRM